jgi:tetratricopeptide (TPR) repeat protein
VALQLVAGAGRSRTPLFVAVLAGAALLCGCSADARKARYLERAENHFTAGEYEKAKIEYENVVRIDPANALAFQRLGTIWLEEGAPFRAASFLTKACELAPKDAVNRSKFATVLISLGRFEEARKILLSVLDDFPSDGEAILLLTDTNKTAEEASVSEDRLQRFGQPESLTVQLVAANLAVQRRDLSSAEIFLQRAITVAPSSPRAHLAMANYLLLRGDLSGAGAELKAAADLSPIRSTTRLQYADFKAQSGEEAEARAILQDITARAPDLFPAWCRLSQISFERNRFQEALSLLENVLKRDPKNVEARALQIEILLATGETKRAVEIAENLDSTYKNVPGIKYQLARAYVRDQNRAQAQAVLNQAIAAKPDYADAILLLAQLDVESGNANIVVQAMSRLLQKQPGLARAQLLLLEAYLSSGQFSEAETVARQLAELSPQAPDPAYRLGLILVRQKKFDEARVAFEKVLDLKPDDLMTINQIVDIDLAQARYDSASAMVERAISKFPDSPIAFFLKGKVLAAQGKAGDAEIALLKAVQLDSNSLGANQLLISTYLVQSKFPEAIKLLQALLSKNPKEPWALKTLAQVCETTRDYVQARDAYESLLSLEPRSTVLLEKLASLYSEHLDNPDKAYEYATQARSLDAVDPRITNTLGWISYKRQDYQQAFNLLREAVEKLGEDPIVQFRFGMASYMMNAREAARIALGKAVNSTLNFPGKEDARQLLGQLTQDSNISEPLSTQELGSIIAARPTDVVTRMRLAALLEKQGEFSSAAAQYEAAISNNPKLLDAKLKLAQLCAGPLHDIAKAWDLAREARDLDRDNPDIARLVGNIAFRTGQFTWAYDLLVQCARSRPQDAEIAYELGWAAYSIGNLAEAERAMRLGLEKGLPAVRGADARRFLMLTGQVSGAKRLPDRIAEAEAQQVLRQESDYVPALLVLARLQQQRGQNTEAVETYIRVLNRFPDFAVGQKELAKLYLAGDPSFYDRAYELAVKARQRLPDDPDVAGTLGRICYHRKNYTYAIQLLIQGTAVRPPDPYSWFYLGMSYFETKALTECRDALKKALAAGLSEPLSSEARRVLGETEAQVGG